MAIQPPYAQAILDGTKLVEFRKRRLATDIDTVLVYESAPTQRIVGHFTIERTESGTPLSLWRAFGSVGCIAREDYLAYYAQSERAVGFVVKGVERYTYPVALAELRDAPAVPQSFSYLPISALEEARALQVADRGWIDRALGLVGAPLRHVGQLVDRASSAIPLPR